MMRGDTLAGAGGGGVETRNQLVTVKVCVNIPTTLIR
jgi:hypothetical protein